MPLGALIILMLMAPVGRAFDQVETPPECLSALCQLIAGGILPELRAPDFSDCKIQVQDFYEGSGYALAWVRNGVETSQAEAIIATLSGAEETGLNPENYDGSRWAGRLARLRDRGQPPTSTDFARFDLALTVCVMRYMADLHFGQLNPWLFHSRFDVEREKRSLPGLAQKIRNALDVKAVFREVEPPFEGYRRTQKALQEYLAMARDDDGGWLPVTDKPVEPGSSYPGAARLISLLHRLGDLPADFTATQGSDTYDKPLVDAVKRFQVRHGLEPDGRVGNATRARLNIPLTRRASQLKLTLERWRWVPREFSRPPIVVNIPEFQLRALNEAYRTEIEMKVVVGKAYGHQTPLFSGEMKHVIFRPYWNVPRSILLAEVLPKLHRDRSYLARNGYEVVNSRDSMVRNGIVDDLTLAHHARTDSRIC